MISNLVEILQTHVQKAAGHLGLVVQRRGSTSDVETTLRSFFYVDENYREGPTRLGERAMGATWFLWPSQSP